MTANSRNTMSSATRPELMKQLQEKNKRIMEDIDKYLFKKLFFSYSVAK